MKKRKTIEVVAVVVGINHWEDITGPFVHSLLRNEPRVQVVVIDNLSDEAYPIVEGSRVVRTKRRLGYGAALNVGMRVTKGADWHICLNNDCLCFRSFLEMFEAADPRIVYGSGYVAEPEMGIVWQRSAWLCISKRVRRAVGLYDRRFDAGYEDVDYEQRALKAGFGLQMMDLPIAHLDHHTRFEERRYSERYQRCRACFFEKHPEFGHLAERYTWLPPADEEHDELALSA